VVSLQLIFTLFAGSVTLLPSLKIFSVYQYLHYVPVMFIISYTFIFERLWRDAYQPYLLLLLWLLLAIYSVMTGSLFIVAAYLICMLSYVIFFGKLKENNRLKTFFGMIFTIVILFTQLQHFNLMKNADLETGPVSMITKVQYGWDQKSAGWQNHLETIQKHPQTFLVGHSNISERGNAASPHNYYLDFIYNFGLVGLLPILALIVFTAYRTWTQYRQVICKANLLYPLLSIIFLLLIENIFYMGLKQPYPGILSFFLWGVYLSRLNQHKKRT
jgi:O-antigen ligase